MISINHKSREPLWEQIYRELKNQIFMGVWSAGEQLPSVRALALELSINPNTIQKAYAELERQGIIRSVTGRGSIVVVSAEDVTSMMCDKISEKIREMAFEAKENGMDLETFCRVAREVFEKEDTL